MSKQVYNWKRFWCPRSGSINLADGGYLYDPDEKWGEAYNPDLVTFEAIFDIPCLALLGEPGVGKTQALRVEESKIASKIQEQGEQILFIDLRSYGSEDRLVRSLFDSTEFKAWQADTHKLHIFLDSFDECLLRVDTLTTLLVDELKRYCDAVHRLCLRIACRTAIWQPVLEGLREIWGENSVGVYELAPLRRIDVVKAAEAEGLPAADFLKKVDQKNIVPLAIKPVTLEFLLDAYYCHGGQFSSNQRLHELYLDGCRLFCEETNESRRGSNRKGILEADQRLMVAARIAAITILANQFAVWTGVDHGNIPVEDVLLQNLCHGWETTNERKFEITRAVIEEVLDTGLFSSRGLHRMGWAHQTYAEFLAAWYLVQHNMPLAQIIRLFSSKDTEYKLIPQLHETAAWLSSMRMDVLQEIVKTDPNVLLRSDIPKDSKLREVVAINLLMQYEQGKLYDYKGNQYQNYETLKHPGLAAQLRPYIQESNRQIDAREAAISIAEVCEVSKLQGELVNLALDSSQSIHLRVSAAKALCSVGDANARLRLKPLAIEQLPEDENDRLKGYALQAVWPNHLTAEELFSALTLPKKGNFLGGYQVFLSCMIIPQLQPHELGIALDWLIEHNVSGHPFKELGNGIIFEAWEHFNFPEIAERFAKVAVLRWSRYRDIMTCDEKMQTQFASSFTDNVQRRYQLVEQVVSIVPSIEEEHSLVLRKIARRMSLRKDVAWMLEKFQGANSEKEKGIWIQLIHQSFDRQDAEAIDAIVVAMQTSDILRKEFASYFGAIDLGSSFAEKMKSDYLEMQEWETHDESSSLLDPPPKKRVLNLLKKLEAGDLQAWWQLNMEMSLQPDSIHYSNEFELDLTNLPGWQEAKEATQKRITEGAKSYVQNQNNLNYEWIGSNTYDRPALAGCRAFQLILKESPDSLKSLSPEVWKRWAPIIIATPSDNQHEDSYTEIVKCAYLNAFQESINTITILIDKENKEHDYISVIGRLDKCWDRRLESALLEKAKDSTLKPKCFGQLLEKLLEREFAEAIDFAKSLISFPLPIIPDECERILIASRTLIENSNPSSWSFVWALIQQHSAFGCEIFELLAYRYHHGIQLNLTEVQLADLYIWLVRQYPYNEDPDHGDKVYSITARDGVARIRDGALSQLKNRGTLQACAEIKRLVQEFPDTAWLRKTLIDVQANMRRKTWKPPTPEEILRLVSSCEPSNLDLLKQLGIIEERTKKMEDEPKIKNEIKISDSSVNAPVGNIGVVNSQKTTPSSNTKQEISWGNWLTVIGVFMTLIAIPLSMSVSGAFNEEFKQWFNHIFSSEVERPPIPERQ